ncbi:MAG: hypothetical protein ACI85H_000795 [Paracoccaceae bacterium]|jgi:hypothetical protein
MEKLVAQRHAVKAWRKVLGCDEAINAHFQHFSAIPSLETCGDPNRAEAIIIETLVNNPDWGLLFLF